MKDVTSSEYGTVDEGDEDGCLDNNDGNGVDEDFNVLESQLEKIKILLKGQEA